MTQQTAVNPLVRAEWRDQRVRLCGRFEALAATAQDTHGEASFCAALLPSQPACWDAGCGTWQGARFAVDGGYAVSVHRRRPQS